MTLSCSTPLWRKIEAVAAQRQSERQAQELARQAEALREREEAQQKRQARKITFPRARILEEVAAKHNVSADRLKCARRFKGLAHARFEAMYRLRTELGISFLRIGAIFNRDHTTVMHGARRFAEMNELPPP